LGVLKALSTTMGRTRTGTTSVRTKMIIMNGLNFDSTSRLALLGRRAVSGVAGLFESVLDLGIFFIP